MNYQSTTKHQKMRGVKNVPFESIQSDLAGWHLCKTSMSQKSYIDALFYYWAGLK